MASAAQSGGLSEADMQEADAGIRLSEHSAGGVFIAALGMGD